MTDQDGTLYPMYPPHLGRLCFGADYNPEQWPSSVWRTDMALMREAGVTMATVGVFSWAWLEPAPGRYEFGWLDEVMDLLAEHGIVADLATATASPPPWFPVAYPRSLPVDRDGRRLTYGSRQAYCPSSPEYREAALALVRALATRYARHPALALWHVNNEYGCHTLRCYCDTSAAAFREWLRARYAKDVDALNEAWGTAFWSQRYTDWEQVIPPRATPSFANPTQDLDFRRFSSDALLALYTAERDVLRELAPGIPVTTNFMTGMFHGLDYWQWAPHLDIVSTDHYLTAADPENWLGLAYAADLTRSLALSASAPDDPTPDATGSGARPARGGRPQPTGEWLLMEHSTSAVNWQPRNVPKRPGQMLRNSLSHVARGSQGAMFFQWRASRAGAEKWHSAMVPHAGPDSQLWRDVVGLGRALERLGPVLGSTVDSPVALLHSYPSIWAQEHPSQPSVDMAAEAEIARWHAALTRLGVTPTLAAPGADLSGYHVVFVPSLYLVSDADAANLESYLDGGGTVLVGPYSGVVDEHDQVRLGGYPGAFAELLGIRVEEYAPLLAGDTVALGAGPVWPAGATGALWSERAHATGAETLASYADGPLAGLPVLTRNSRAWYVGTRPVDADLRLLLGAVCGSAGVRPPVADPPPGLEVVRRVGDGGTSYLFLLNHADSDVTLPRAGTDLLTGAAHETVRIPAGGAVVLREAD